MMVTAMDDADDLGRGRFWRVLRIIGLSLALVFLVGVVAGFSAAHQEKGGEITLRFLLILTPLIALVIGCGWLLFRSVKRPTGEAPPTTRERLNRNILVASGVLGLIVGMIMSRWGDGTSIFSNEPLPQPVALALIGVVGVLAPLLSLFWHRRATDEQETAAYKTGALYAINAYMIVAPVWWLAWRGGFAPVPDGIAIYFLTITVMMAVWLWKKYR